MTVIPTTLAHARAIDLRDEDSAELAALDSTAENAVRIGLARGLWTETYIIGGEVAAIAGLVPQHLLSNVGCPWLITGQPVERHKRLFLRETAKRLADMRTRFPVLINYIDARYERSLRWARWLGFEIGAAVPYGPHGAPFRPVVLKRGA